MNELLKELVEKGLSTHKIAKEIGRSQTFVRYNLNKLGLTTVRASDRIKLCISCGEELTKKSQRKYCSSSCQWDNTHYLEIQKWLRGEIGGSGPNGELRTSFKKYLIKEAEYKCPRCQWCEPNPILNRPILTVDHIDGDWSNNARDNLTVLCYNCHTLTPTFGTLNKKAKGNRRNGSRSGNKPVIDQ